MVCIFKSYLNSQILSNDDKLSIPCYNMIRADHPSDNRHGGVCVYCKKSLPNRLYNISYLQERIWFNLMITNKLSNIVSLYRSPSPNRDEFENFINNLNLTLESITEKKPFLTILLGDFNAKHNNWCSDDRPTQPPRKGLKLIMLHLSFFYHK